MQTLTQPTLLLKPFAQSGDKNTLPVTNTDASNPQLADLTNGFPAITSEDPDNGGLPPERKDFNGLGYLTTTYDYFYQAGGTFTFDQTTAVGIGGYPLGARLWYGNGTDGWILRSTVKNNYDDFVNNKTYDSGTGTWVNKTGIIGTTWVKDTLTSSEIDSKITTLLYTLYPVGSLYIGTQSSCPMSTLMPGTTWSIVGTNRALWGGSGTNGNTTINAGLPNIKDNFYFADTYYGQNFIMDSDSGLIKYTNQKVSTASRHRPDNDGSTSSKQKFTFDASKVNSLFGASTTVQPPAYRVNVWRRTA